MHKVTARVRAGSNIKRLLIQGQRPTVIHVEFDKDFLVPPYFMPEALHKNVHDWIDEQLFPALDIHFTDGILDGISNEAPPLGIKPFFFVLEDAYEEACEAVFRAINKGAWEPAGYLVREAMKIQKLAKEERKAWQQIQSL